MIEPEDKELLKSLGEKIREVRLSKNLSQENLSFDANLSRNQVGRIERGEFSASITTLRKISSALGIKTKDLIDF